MSVRTWVQWTAYFWRRDKIDQSLFLLSFAQPHGLSKMVTRVFLAMSAILDRHEVTWNNSPAAATCIQPTQVSKTSIACGGARFFVAVLNTFMSIILRGVLNEISLAISFSTERNANTVSSETTALWKTDFLSDNPFVSRDIRIKITFQFWQTSLCA